MSNQHFLIMNTSIDKIPLVEKEKVNTLHFPVNDVLKDKDSIAQRVAALHHATSLGNLNQHKVNILFEDSEGMKRVITTIWAITDKRIILKNNRTIPIKRIHSVTVA